MNGTVDIVFIYPRPCEQTVYKSRRIDRRGKKEKIDRAERVVQQKDENRGRR